MTKIDEVIKLYETWYAGCYIVSALMLETLLNVLILNNREEFKEIKNELLRIYLNLPTSNINDFVLYLKKEAIKDVEPYHLSGSIFYPINHLFIWKDTKKGYNFWDEAQMLLANTPKIKVIANKEKVKEIFKILDYKNE